MSEIHMVVHIVAQSTYTTTHNNYLIFQWSQKLLITRLESAGSQPTQPEEVSNVLGRTKYVLLKKF